MNYNEIRNRILCLLIVFCGLNAVNNNCCAIKVAGYILNENSDTIHGTIQLSRFNQVTGAFKLNGIELESLHSRVVFRGLNDRAFETYFPEEIMGFGFKYKFTEYFFNRFAVIHNSIVQNESQQFRFLCLIHKGAFELYKDITTLYNPINQFDYDQYLTYSDYYLYRTSNGLFKVEYQDNIRNLRDLMEQAGADFRFIQFMPQNIRFKDIQALLIIYDRWVLCEKD